MKLQGKNFTLVDVVTVQVLHCCCQKDRKLRILVGKEKGQSKLEDERCLAFAIEAEGLRQSNHSRHRLSDSKLCCQAPEVVLQALDLICELYVLNFCSLCGLLQLFFQMSSEDKLCNAFVADCRNLENESIARLDLC